MDFQKIGTLTSSPVITRHPANPLLSAEDVPYLASLVFNAGIAKFHGRYVMVFRNDYAKEPMRLSGTNLGLAFSDDGIQWTVEPEPFWDSAGPEVSEAAAQLYGGHLPEGEIQRAYDPRLTVIDGRCYMCFAFDTAHGLRGGIAVTDDFARWEMLSLTAPDNRNMVLFPERMNGNYIRLERPMTFTGSGMPNRFHVWSSLSPDLKLWGNARPVLGAESVPFANDKIGPGAPPVRTEEGWLAVFHAVDIDNDRGKNGWEAAWRKRYTVGIMLLDLDDPQRVIGMSKEPLLAPAAGYEVSGGFRNNTIFPGGMILEESGEVKIYYGAADTVECLATADVADLIGLCSEKP